MSEIDVIKQIARQALTVPAIAGTADNWLWDRAQRLVRNSEHICVLRELTDSNLPIDRFCLIAATYFCDSGFARYVDAKDTCARLVMADVSEADLRNFSNQIVADRLSSTLKGPKIDKINRIISESGNRQTKMTEAKILSDARSLDDMGAVGTFNEFRRYVVHGKGVSDAVESWKRKVEYRYWQARLKESFRFESVRRIAARRFATAEYFMCALAEENSAKDLEDVVIESLDEDSGE